MSTKVCPNGHSFEKSSSCPVYPICSPNEMKENYGQEFPGIGAPAFCALDGFGPKALRLLKDALRLQGLSLAQE